MRLFRLTTTYEAYLRRFYAARPGLAGKPYEVQKQALDHDAFGWGDGWKASLGRLGYEVEESALNAALPQRAWARERLPAGEYRPHDIAVAQVSAFAPDLLWYDHGDEALLERLRAACPTIRHVVGWSGSAIPETKVWSRMDLILTCAPEAAEWFRAHGLRAEVLHHPFDPRVLEGLAERPPRYEASFVGQIARGDRYHREREKLLRSLLGRAPLAIFSPGAEEGMGAWARALARVLAHGAVRMLRAAGMPETALRRLPGLRKAATWKSPPAGPLRGRLRRALRPPVFGLEMYQVLRDSRVTLNIHADSSPRFASNMRLFEATGVGTCLLTDWRENLPELFDPEREVVAYRSAAECAERLRWLLDHPEEGRAIARAGQARTLRDHTFARRAERLDALLREVMA